MLKSAHRVGIKPTLTYNHVLIEHTHLFLTLRIVWSKTFFEDNLVFHGMGVRFSYIFGDGRESLEDILDTCIIDWREKDSGD